MGRKEYSDFMNPSRLGLLIGLSLGLLALAACGPSAPSVSLPEAAKRGDLRLVKQHIAAKSKLETRDSSGLAAVHHAAIRGDVPMLQALAAAGADLNLGNAVGKTPLDLARLNGKIPAAKFLLDRPAGGQGGGGRGLVDGGLGVSSVLDSQ
jgi:ankyrin repeat protein